VTRAASFWCSWRCPFRPCSVSSGSRSTVRA
jgi:hypothetical protein